MIRELRPLTVLVVLGGSSQAFAQALTVPSVTSSVVVKKLMVTVNFTATGLTASTNYYMRLTVLEQGQTIPIVLDPSVRFTTDANGAITANIGPAFYILLRKGVTYNFKVSVHPTGQAAEDNTNLITSGNKDHTTAAQ